MSPELFRGITACWVNRCDSRNRPLLFLDLAFSEYHRTATAGFLRCPSLTLLALQTGSFCRKLKAHGEA